MLKRKLIDLTSQREAKLNAAQDALLADNQEEYRNRMDEVRNLNAEIDNVQALIAEQERNVIAPAPTAAEARDMAEERASQLRAGREIKFSAAELMRGLKNSTIVSGSIVQPTGAGTEVRDGLGQTTLLDLVSVQDMTGLGSWDEPYAIADQTPAVGAPETVGGTARNATDPSFGIAQIKPYEVSVTSFVDRNISRLSPVAYVGKIQQMAMRALRNKIAGLILIGDAEATHVMYGMVNGTNKAGATIIQTIAAPKNGSVGKIDENFLTDLYFGYGNGYEAGPAARLFCNKADLKAWGKLRGTNEKGRLFSVTPDAGAANRGVLSDGGMLVPYLLDPNLAAIEGGTGKCVYGDPMNYLLGLFGEFTVRVDESVKAVERMNAILGDAVVGGNVVVDKGFVVGEV